MYICMEHMEYAAAVKTYQQHIPTHEIFATLLTDKCQQKSG